MGSALPISSGVETDELQNAVNRALQVQESSWNQIELEKTSYQEPLIVEEIESDAHIPPFFENFSVELIKQTSISGVGEDFSGLSYGSLANSYFIIDDRCHILEVILNQEVPKVIRNISLLGLDDCEARALLESDNDKEMRVVVAEERRGNLAIFSLGAEDEKIDIRRRGKIYHALDVGPFWRRNRGIEAVAIDQSSSESPIFYVGKEEMPRMVLRGDFMDEKFLFSIPWDS